MTIDRKLYIIALFFFNLLPLTKHIILSLGSYESLRHAAGKNRAHKKRVSKCILAGAYSKVSSGACKFMCNFYVSFSL